MISKDSIKRIVDSVNIVDVVSSYIPIKNMGANYFGKCPFHEEKTQSFSVSERKQFYYCFGCGASGDAIKFIQQYESLAFPLAVKKLAIKCGIDIDDSKATKGYITKKERDLLELDRMVIKIYLHDKGKGITPSPQDENRYQEALKRKRG